MSHHRQFRQLPRTAQHLERQRSGHQLARNQRFQSACARNELSIVVTLETPETARSLRDRIGKFESGMHGLESILLDNFIEGDYGDSLLLLTASEERTGTPMGMVFWRYLESVGDEYWEHVNVQWKSAHGKEIERTLPNGKQFSGSWTLIELLCTNEAHRGHGVGKLLLVAALAYSSVVNGKTAAVLTLGSNDDNEAAHSLYDSLGFEQMPEHYFGPSDSEHHVDPSHVLVLWDIKRSLKSLRLADVDGSKNGSHLAQLEDCTDQRLQRLDSAACRNVVERLAHAPSKSEGDCECD